MTAELRAMSAALNRAGNNVNQVARRLNEAKLKGEPLRYGAESHAGIRDLAGLVFDMSDQIQELYRARRRTLDLEVTTALAGLRPGRVQDCPRKGLEAQLGASRRKAVLRWGSLPRPRAVPFTF